jgi:hypothetical protein
MMTPVLVGIYQPIGFVNHLASAVAAAARDDLWLRLGFFDFGRVVA